MTTPPPPTAPEGGEMPFWFADWRPDDVPISEWQLFWNECTANFRALPPLAAQAGAADMLSKLRAALTKWPRCCDLHQDSLGGMHCLACAQKTFAMLREAQEILGVDKACNPLPAPPVDAMGDERGK